MLANIILESIEGTTSRWMALIVGTLSIAAPMPKTMLLIDDRSPNHALENGFIPHVFPAGVAIGYTIMLLVASIPFCASLLYLAKLFSLYSHRDLFTAQNAKVMRRIAHSIMATGYSPLLLGPVAHAIGVLRPVSGMTAAMIAFFLLGLILLAISDVMEVGRYMQQDQDEIL